MPQSSAALRMTEHRVLSARQDSRRPTTLVAQPRVSDRINTTMKRVEAAGLCALRDPTPGQARPVQLRGGHDSVLIGRQACDRRVPTGFAAFAPHSGAKATTPPISPPFIAGVRPDDPDLSPALPRIRIACTFPRRWRPNAH
jgi:hypothetical protein